MTGGLLNPKSSEIRHYFFHDDSCHVLIASNFIPKNGFPVAKAFKEPSPLVIQQTVSHEK